MQACFQVCGLLSSSFRSRCDGFYNQSVGRLSIFLRLFSRLPRPGAARLPLLLGVVPLLSSLAWCCLFLLLIFLPFLLSFSFLSVHTVVLFGCFVGVIHRASPESKASFPLFAPERCRSSSVVLLLVRTLSFPCPCSLLTFFAFILPSSSPYQNRHTCQHK